MIDLHTHSTASDGTLSPEAVVDLAAEKGLTALALTDHDTVAGIPPAQARAGERGIELVPGVELGIRWEGPGTMHILGYCFRHDDGELRERLAWLRMCRRVRAERIVGKLNHLGCGISFGRVEEIAGGESIGRPHVAQALVEAGAVSSVADAFARYLSRGRPGFVEKKQLNPEEAIRLLKSCGGVAVLAHPATLKLGLEALSQLVEELKGKGLEGLEVSWSGHNERQVRAYTELAGRLGLLTTGGSDFHGENKPDIELGTGRHGNVKVEPSVLVALREHRRASAAGPS